MEKRKVKVLNTKSPKFKKHKLRLLLKPHMNCWKSLHLGRNLIPCSCQIQIETENYIELLSSFKKQIYLKVIFNTIGNREGGTGGTDRGYLGTPIFWGLYRVKNGK